MSMMFSKWRHKGESAPVATGGGGFGAAFGKEGGDGGASEHRGYRTHLLFTGKRGDAEGASGPSSVLPPSGPQYYAGPQSPALSSSSHSNHPFAQAQQIRPHHHHHHPETPRRKGSRSVDEQGSKQVSFGGSGNTGWTTNEDLSHQLSPTGVSGTNDDSGKPGMLEVVAGLSRDCFIIPLACVDRFLPAGLKLPEIKPKPSTNPVTGAPLNVLEVTDPQLAVVVHLMTPLNPLNPHLESPLSQPERIQKNLAMQLLQKAAGEKQASQGLLLASMETNSDFPLIALYVVPKLRTDAADFVETARKDALDTFDPTSLGYFGDHFFHLCREVATIARPSVDSTVKKGNNSSTGYIVSIFRVLDGDDREKLERNWLYWTGARTLYRLLPKSVGLRRITLHKSAAVRGDKLYLLLCECANFLENVSSAAQLLPALRARLCGYTGIYRVAGTF